MTRTLSDISLVCIETRFPALALFAIEYSLRHLSFKEILLFSSEKIDTANHISNVVIAPIKSTEEYSRFVIKELPNYITTDFVLIIQWDGFVINGDCWTEEFKNYDYIGAPWFHRPVKVGNGGFSLRSQKLLRAAQSIEMETYHPEDRCICETYRDRLEQDCDIRFAPEEVAAKFAFEGIAYSHPTFGFHGIFNFHLAIHDDALHTYVKQIPTQIAITREARHLVKNLYRKNEYKAALILLKKRIPASLQIGSDGLLLAIRCLMHGAFSYLKYAINHPISRRPR